MIINRTDKNSILIKYSKKVIFREELISLIVIGALIGGICFWIKVSDQKGVFDWNSYLLILLVIFLSFVTNKWFYLLRNWQKTITVNEASFKVNNKTYIDTRIEFVYARNIGKSDHGRWLFIRGEKHKVTLFKRLSEKELNQIREQLTTFYDSPFREVDADTVM